MKYAMLGVLVAATACTHLTPQVAPLPLLRPDLAIVSWNLDEGEGDVRQLLADLRAGRLVSVPSEMVLLLQEARRGVGTRIDIEDVARELDLFLFFAPVRFDEGTEQGHATLSTLPLIGARTIELPRERQRRTASVASVNYSGQTLLVVNGHLENRASWWKGGLPGDRARGRQMRALLRELPDNVPGILGGDFNIWLGTSEPAYQAASERFPDARPARALMTYRERLPLDHVFLRLPPAWRAEHFRFPSRYGSDHVPVMTVVESVAPDSAKMDATPSRGTSTNISVLRRRRPAP